MEQDDDERQRATNHIGYSGSCGSAEVGAEMFCGHRHKQRPEARTEAHNTANEIHACNCAVFLPEVEHNTEDGDGKENKQCLLTAFQHMAH